MFKKVMILSFVVVVTLFTCSTFVPVSSKTLDQPESEMAEKQEDLNQAVTKAGKKEKLYTLKEILSLPEDQFPRATPQEVVTIKHQITRTLNSLSLELREKYASQEFPLSMVYIDNSQKNSDAVLAGGGLPNCLDDNGWGPAHFINSDCNIAMAVVSQYRYESIVRIRSLRYCRSDLRRNCSPRIGHSPYWHKH